MLVTYVSLRERKQVSGTLKRRFSDRTYRSIYSDSEIRSPTRRRINKFLKPFKEEVCFKKNSYSLRSFILSKRVSRFSIQPRRVNVSRHAKLPQPLLFSNCPSSLSSNMISSHRLSAELNFQGSLIPQSSATTLLFRCDLSPSWQLSDSEPIEHSSEEFNPSNMDFAYNTPVQDAKKSIHLIDLRDRNCDLFDSRRESFKPRLRDLPNYRVFWNNKIRANRLLHLFC